MGRAVASIGHPLYGSRNLERARSWLSVVAPAHVLSYVTVGSTRPVTVNKVSRVGDASKEAAVDEPAGEASKSDNPPPWRRPCPCGNRTPPSHRSGSR